MPKPLKYRDNLSNEFLFKEIDNEIKKILEIDSEIGVITIKINVRNGKEYMAIIEID